MSQSLWHQEKVCKLYLFIIRIQIFTAVGKTPQSLMSDPEWDKKTHPWLDPTGENNMNKERRVKLSNIMFFDQRFRNINRMFANCLSFVYAAVSYIELKQMTDKINISVQRGARNEDGFQVFDNVKNTPR